MSGRWKQKMCIRDRSYVFDVEKEHFLPATEYINSLPTVEYASSETLAPVSYTHLDVYKRQDEGFDDDLGDEEPDEASLAQIEADNGNDLFDGE